MAAKLVVVGKNTEDLVFADELGREIEREVVNVTVQTRLEQILVDDPRSLVLVEADDSATFQRYAKSIYGRVPRSRVFVVTDDSLNDHPGLFGAQIFGHHLRRRYGSPAARVIGKVMLAATEVNPFGLDRYFAKNDLGRVQNITIDQSSKRSPAVEAVRKFLEKLGITSRMASKIAQGTDELLMNAIYDAPVLKDGTHYRHSFSRQSPFELEAAVTLSFAEGEKYAAISVTDAFGSVDREKVMFCMKKNYAENNYVVRPSDQGVGLGLNSIIQSDLSLEIISRPKMKTESILFFPKVARVKDLRTSFGFFGLIGL